MRRERRNFARNNSENKRVLYIGGGIITLSIIVAIAISILFSGNDNSTELARFNTSTIDSLGANSLGTEETSTQMGRTVNEMKDEETNELENEISNVISNDVNDKEDEQKKYAVNTNASNKKSDEEQTTNTEKEIEEQIQKEEEKDPEFIIPVEGEILKAYAKDNLVYSTTLDEWITHNGLDIAAEKTTVVKAAADGTVKSIKNDPRYGLTVTIEHQNGFSTVYSNLLTAEFVEEGEKVEQGDTIGTVGNTATFEIADEPHLHFEILKDSQNVDPELYINK